MQLGASRRPKLFVAGLLFVLAGSTANAQTSFDAIAGGRPNAVNILGTVVTQTGQRVQLSGSTTSYGVALTDVSDNDLVMISPNAGKWRAGSWSQLLGVPYTPPFAQPIYGATTVSKCDSSGAYVVGYAAAVQSYCQGFLIRWNSAGAIDPIIASNDIRCEGLTALSISGDGKAVANGVADGRLSSQFYYANRISSSGITTFTGWLYDSTFAGMNASGTRVAGRSSFMGTLTKNGLFSGNNAEEIAFPADFLLTRMSENERQFAGYRYNASQQQIARIRKSDGTLVDLSQYLAQRGVTAAAGWTLNEVTAISRDGAFIAGVGVNPSGATASWRVNLCQLPLRFTETSGASLTPRWQQALTWNGQASAFIGFGGRNATGTFNNDTVRWDGAAWQTLIFATAPGARADHAIASDLAGNSYMFGGQTQAGGLLSDCWKFDGTAWTQLTPATPPSATGGHTMSYDIARDRIVMFGGFSESSGSLVNSGNTYDFNPANNTWTLRLTSGPAPRFAHTMAYDPVQRQTILFGGYNGTSQYLGDTWVWNGQGEWVQLTGPGPSPRFYSTLQWDPSRQGLLLTGGRDASGVLSDQWILTSAGWQQLSEPFAGGAVWTHAAATSPMGDMIIAGGSAANFLVKDDTYVSTKDPVIAFQPQPQVAYLGQNVSFTVSASGGYLEYVWERDGLPVSNGGRIFGATTPTLTITNVQASDLGSYRARVTNCASFVRSSDAALNVASCDSIDFNNNSVFPEDQDVIDFFLVLAGGECSACNDIDFNNNDVFPEDQDVIDFFNVLAGGACP